MTPVCSRSTLKPVRSECALSSPVPPSPSKGCQVPGTPAACQPVVALQRVTVTSAGEHMATAANPDGDNEVERSKYPVSFVRSL